MFYYLAVKLYLNYHTKIHQGFCFFLAGLCYFLLISNYKSDYYSLIIPMDLAYAGLVVSREVKLRYLILGEKDQLATLNTGNVTKLGLTDILSGQDPSNVKGKGISLDKDMDKDKDKDKIKDKLGHNVVDKIIPGEIGQLNLSHLLDLGDTPVSKQKILKKLSSLNILETEDRISRKLPKIKYKPHKIQLSSPLQQTVKNLGI